VRRQVDERDAALRVDHDVIDRHLVGRRADAELAEDGPAEVERGKRLLQAAARSVGRGHGVLGV
jgi:hypothetical protein